MALVRRIAVDLCRSYGLDIDFDELVSYGFLGLVEAADRFDPARGLRFSTFAYHRIRGAILDGLAELGPLPRSRARAGRPLRCGTSVAALPSQLPSADGALEQARELERVRSMVGHLPPRTRYLIERYYWGTDSLVDIGRELGVSKSRASRIHSAALRKLREHLEECDAA